MSGTHRPSGLAGSQGLIATVGLAMVLIGVAIAALAGPASQWGFWDFRLGFIIVRWAVYGTAVGGALCLVSVLMAVAVHKTAFVRKSAAALAGLVIAVTGVSVPYILTKPGNPPIHDITTDMDDPPLFVAVLPLRAQTKATNTAAYQREWRRPDRVINVPDLQKQAFPDIQPVVLEMPPSEAFAKAASAVRTMKWAIVDENPEAGRIEAFDRTAWFGFIDDVVIRIRPEGSGSRVDVRSVSRVGGGDRGLNAKRIRAYLRALTG